MRLAQMARYRSVATDMKAVHAVDRATNDICGAIGSISVLGVMVNKEKIVDVRPILFRINLSAAPSRLKIDRAGKKSHRSQRLTAPVDLQLQ